MTYRKVQNFVTRTIAGETIAVPIRARAAELDSVYVFNEVGATIWNLIDGSRTREEIAALIVHDFDVPLQKAQEDVAQFLEALLSAGVVQTGAP